MSQYDHGWLAQITAAPLYVYRCNGLPEQGIRIRGTNLRATLATGREVTPYTDGSITWRGTAGRFTAEPVADQPPA